MIYSLPNLIIDEVPGFYCVRQLGVLRRTEGVAFDFVPMDSLAEIDAIDRVIHRGGAISPGAIGNVKRPWYMHTEQTDNLLVLHGKRTVDIFQPEHGMHQFEVTADRIMKDGELLFEGPAMLTWHQKTFHRVHSDETVGSASLNIASRTEQFDINTNFSVYSLNTETGEYEVIRAGHLDQPSG